MALNNVNLQAADGGLGRRAANDDGTSGLLTTGVATSELDLGKTYELKELADAVALGIDAAYDTANNVLVYHHIREFFRTSRAGDLYLMLVAQTVTLTQMCDIDNDQYIKKMAADAKGRIRQFGVGRNPAVGYTPTTTGGMDTDVFGAIPKAGQMVDWLWDNKRPAVILIEGRSFTGTPTSATDLRTLVGKGVAVTIQQDLEVASAHAILNGYAAIGTALGITARRRVNESVMYVADGNLQSVADGLYLTDSANDNLGLSSHLPVSSYTDTQLGTLSEKHYWFGRTFTDFQGVYMADSGACTLSTSDYAYLETSRTMTKAARLVYVAFVPELGRPMEVDTDTGRLAQEVCKAFETLGLDALEPMTKGREVSGIEVFVDPAQNVLATSELEVEFAITPTGTARRITGTLKFNNPFNA